MHVFIFVPLPFLYLYLLLFASAHIMEINYLWAESIPTIFIKYALRAAGEVVFTPPSPFHSILLYALRERQVDVVFTHPYPFHSILLYALRAGGGGCIYPNPPPYTQYYYML